MSDLVPPGGDRPIDAEPWPVATPNANAATPQLPVVPVSVPAGIEAPQDWRSLPDSAGPSGYRGAESASAAPTSPLRPNRWGAAACCVAAVGLIQILLVRAPLLSMLAISLGFTARRYVDLDPDGIRQPELSSIGVIMGVVGVAIGAILWWRFGLVSSVVPG